MQDLLIPNNNELALAHQAQLLNHISITFLKPFKRPAEIKQYGELLKNQNMPIKYNIGILIQPTKPKDLQLAKKLKPFVKTIVVISDGSEKLNRACLETPHIDYVFNLATATGRDHTHYRRGGVNQVHAKLARDNQITYGISFEKLLAETNWRRVKLLGRWLFNAKIFKKYKVPIEVFSLASQPENVRSPSILAATERIIKL